MAAGCGSRKAGPVVDAGGFLAGQMNKPAKRKITQP